MWPQPSRHRLCRSLFHQPSAQIQTIQTATVGYLRATVVNEQWQEALHKLSQRFIHDVVQPFQKFTNLLGLKGSKTVQKVAE